MCTKVFRIYSEMIVPSGTAIKPRELITLPDIDFSDHEVVSAYYRLN